MILPIVMMICIFLLSSIPGTPGLDGYWLVASLDPTLQNILHVPLFATLQILWLRSLSNPERTEFATVATSLTLTGSYGLLDELHQGFVPGRHASVLDCLLNLLGSLVGTAIWYGIALLKRKKRLRTLN